MLKKFVLGGMVVVAALLGNACGDDGSSDSPAAPADGEVSLSSSDDVVLGNSSSSSVTESPSTSSGQVSQSAESDGSSSSEKAVGGSSSSDGKASSSSGKVESSSGKGEKSSSSEGVAGSSSSDVVAESSSSEKSSSSVAESSSSVESSSSEEQSSSSVVESSSSVAESSSSSEDDVSSSSEYYKLSWDYLNPSIPYDTIIDSRDGQVYKVVTVGSLIWMAENLNYYDTIQSPDLKRHSWCLNDRVVNCEHYGRYYDNPIALDYDSTQTSAVYKRYMNEEGGYDSLSVVGVCPNGWRIPTRSEWLHLDSSCKVRSAQWNGENSCGVSIYNSGYRYLYQDSVSYFRNGAYFWTASYNSSAKPSTIVFEKNGLSGVYGIFRGSGLSIRCVKDN